MIALLSIVLVVIGGRSQIGENLQKMFPEIVLIEF